MYLPNSYYLVNQKDYIIILIPIYLYFIEIIQYYFPLHTSKYIGNKNKNSTQS